jgi:capsular exopolysaccharide synthesis family protein
VHRKFDLSGKSGLTDVLVGNASVEAVIQPTPIDNLSIITGLPLPPDPSLLLSGEGMANMLDQCGAMFDNVVIDTPPLLGLSDTVSMASLVDGILFVVDATSFHRGAVKSALRRLHLVGAPLLGVVLTKFNPQESDYYGYNYYSYGSEPASAG